MPFGQHTQQQGSWRYLAFILIAVVVFLAYYPTLLFPPRSDQIAYIAETAQMKPVPLILGSYDLNRHRVYAPGDEILFRPLVYVILGCEVVLFGHHFWAWQLFGIVAHLILVWILLRLMWRLSNGWLAFAGAWLFALAGANLEMVSWPHLTGYIFMASFVLLAIEQIILCFEKGQLSKDRAVRITVYFCAGCLMYETVNLFALWVTFLLFVFFSQQRRYALIVSSPVILYIACSLFNYSIINHLSVAFHTSGFGGASPLRLLWALVAVGFWWCYAWFFNGMYDLDMGGRFMFKSGQAMVFQPPVLHEPQVIWAMMLLAALLGMMWINRQEFFNRFKILVLLAGMAVLYLGVIVCGRQNPSLLENIRVNSYYPYIFWVILMPMLFVLMGKGNSLGRQRWLVGAFVIFAVLSGVWQGQRLFRECENYSRRSNDILVLTNTLDLLVSEKGWEKNFSFYVDTKYPGNFVYPLMRKKTDILNRPYTYAELIYPQYFQPRAQAKYRFLTR